MKIHVYGGTPPPESMLALQKLVDHLNIPGERTGEANITTDITVPGINLWATDSGINILN